MGIPIINCALNIHTEDALAVPRINECERISSNLRWKKKRKKKKGGRSGRALCHSLAMTVATRQRQRGRRRRRQWRRRQYPLAWCLYLRSLVYIRFVCGSRFCFPWNVFACISYPKYPVDILLFSAIIWFGLILLHMYVILSLPPSALLSYTHL